MPEPEQTTPRDEVLHLEVTAPQVVLAFQAPAQSTDGFAACEILSEILVSGESSRLYRRLVIEEKIALDVSGYLAPFSDPGLFEIGVQGRPGSNPERIVEIVQEELERLGAQGVSDTECSKARNTLELSLLLGLKDARRQPGSENLLIYVTAAVAVALLERPAHSASLQQWRLRASSSGVWGATWAESEHVAFYARCSPTAGSPH
mgnify:CR=1 FL=1